MLQCARSAYRNGWLDAIIIIIISTYFQYSVFISFSYSFFLSFCSSIRPDYTNRKFFFFVGIGQKSSSSFIPSFVWRSVKRSTWFGFHRPYNHAAKYVCTVRRRIEQRDNIQLYVESKEWIVLRVKENPNRERSFDNSWTRVEFSIETVRFFRDSKKRRKLDSFIFQHWIKVLEKNSPPTSFLLCNFLRLLFNSLWGQMSPSTVLLTRLFFLGIFLF